MLDFLDSLEKYDCPKTVWGMTSHFALHLGMKDSSNWMLVCVYETSGDEAESGAYAVIEDAKEKPWRTREPRIFRYADSALKAAEYAHELLLRRLPGSWPIRSSQRT
jgi:hypothetical protein